LTHLPQPGWTRHRPSRSSLQASSIAAAHTAHGVRDQKHRRRSRSTTCVSRSSACGLSATPAELFGASQELGALAPGRAANLSLVEGDLANKERSVRHVFVAGRHFEGAPKKEAKPEEKPKEGAAAAAAGLTGTWSLQPLQPGAHTSGFESKLTLKQEGTKLSGRLESEMGEGELSGSADDAAVRFTIVAQFQGQRFEFKFVGKADGADRLTGTLETPFGKPLASPRPRAAFRTASRAFRLTGTLETPFGKPLEVEAKRAPKGARQQEASR